MGLKQYDFKNTQTQSIPEDRAAIISSVINSTVKTGTVNTVTVTVDIEHTYLSDLTISLESPSGKTIQLANKEGFKEDNFHLTTFDDSANESIKDGKAPFTGTFRPVEKLSELKNSNPHGKWTLHIDDKAAVDGGTLKSWEIRLVVADLSFDYETYVVKKKQMTHLKAALRAYKYYNCVKGKGGFGNTNAVINCMNLEKTPPIPSPPIPSPPPYRADENILAELMNLMDQDELNQVGEILSRKQDEYIENIISELKDFDFIQ